MTTSRKALILLLAITATIPALLTALFIHHYGVNARYCDDWWFFTDLLLKGARGTLTFTDLFAQYNESRTVFPRLVILALNKLFHGDIRAQYYFSFALAAATAVNLLVLSRMTGIAQPRRLWLLALASILIFSPIQYQTWLWGVQIVVFFPIFSLSLALLISESKLPPWPKFIASLAVCLFATFSHANGMLLWPLIAIALAARIAPDPGRRVLSVPAKTRIAFAAIWILAASLSLLLYFHNYTKPYWTPGFLPALQHPFVTLHFFFALLGMPLGWGLKDHAIAASTALGLFQVALLVLLVVRIIRQRKWRGPALAWLIFAGHVLLTAALTAAGRAGFGVNYAATLRYTSYSLFITVAIIYLVPFAFEFPRQLIWKLLAIAAVFLTLLTIEPACAQTNRYRTIFLAGRAGLHYILVLGTQPQPGDVLSPGDKALPAAAGSLNSIGYLNPPLARSTTIPRNAPPSPGRLDAPQFTAQTFTVSGVALLPDRPADAVVIAAAGSSGEQVAIAVIPLDDIAAQGRFLRPLSVTLPTGAAQITAFAVDGYTSQMYAIPGAFPIPKSPATR